MKVGTKVSWTQNDGSTGTGLVEAPGSDAFHSLVAVEPPRLGVGTCERTAVVHSVIHCAGMFLKVT